MILADICDYKASLTHITFYISIIALNLVLVNKQNTLGS